MSSVTVCHPCSLPTQLVDFTIELAGNTNRINFTKSQGCQISQLPGTEVHPGNGSNHCPRFCGSHRWGNPITGRMVFLGPLDNYIFFISYQIQSVYINISAIILLTRVCWIWIGTPHIDWTKVEFHMWDPLVARGIDSVALCPVRPERTKLQLILERNCSMCDTVLLPFQIFPHNFHTFPPTHIEPQQKILIQRRIPFL